MLFAGATALAAPVLGLVGEQGARGIFSAVHRLYWLAADLAARAPLLLPESREGHAAERTRTPSIEVG